MRHSIACTTYKIVRQYEDVLHNISALGRLFKNASAICAYKKCTEACRVAFNCLLSLFLSDFVDRLNLSQLLVREVASPYSPIPTEWLERCQRAAAKI